ncbi:MAG: molybdenum cofactor biosynthesis protein MoaE [Prochlorococcus sp.]|nr:molybdenum cofactor biosynthesis protein MoaE [Prochlorococcaceae cyanobacterium Fu_MAG_50]
MNSRFFPLSPVAEPTALIEIRRERFSPWRELEQWQQSQAAVAVFVGRVRAEGLDGSTLEALELQHYPGMTEARLRQDAEHALVEHTAFSALLLHRVGRLLPGEEIVLVAVAADHRGNAQRCCAALLESLKHRAPFWKREWCNGVGEWVTHNTSL